MADREIRAILFDLGDTLIRFGRFSAPRMFALAGRYSFEYLRGLGQPTGSYRRHLWASLIGLRLHLLWSSLTRDDFDSFEILKRRSLRQGVRLTEEQWDEYHWQWYRPLAESATVEPGLAETLGKLRQRGLELGIISNTFVHGSALDRHLEQEGLLEFFPMRLYSYEMHCRKPDKRVFLEAARRMGVEPERTAYVGDRVDNDVIGARRAGMLPVLIRAHTNHKKRIPDGTLTVSSLSELPAVLRASSQADPA